MTIEIGDIVAVTDQHIVGEVVELYGNLAVICDFDSEFEDDRLEFKTSELQTVMRETQ